MRTLSWTSHGGCTGGEVCVSNEVGVFFKLV